MGKSQFLSTESNGGYGNGNARGKGRTQILPNRSYSLFKNSQGAQMSLSLIHI